MSNLNTVWTKYVPKEDRPDTEEMVKRSVTILRLLKTIWEKEQEFIHNKMGTDNFDSPNWPLQMAHWSGHLARIKRDLDLVSFIKD